MKAKLFVRAIALIALVTTLLIGSTMLASAPQISVELCVELSRFSGGDEPVVYDLVDAGGTVVASGESATAVLTPGSAMAPSKFIEACFTTVAVPSAVYDVVFRSDSAETDHLTNVIAGQNFQTDGETIMLQEGGGNAVLIEGDGTNDNQINDSDFSIWVSAVDPILGSCFPTGHPADYNEDGCLDDSDYSIWVSNVDPIFGTPGDAYTP